MQKLTFNFQKAQRIIQKIGAIDEFKGKWSLKFAKHLPLEKLGMLVLSENASASARLETQVPKAVTYQAQFDAYQHASRLVLDQNTSFSWETIENIYLAMQGGNNDVARYRKQATKLAFSIAEHLIFFRPMPTPDIAEQLKEEVYKTNAYMDKRQLHPLIVIADFMYEFMMICPFETHNLQVSRLIAQQLLFQLDYTFVEYLSLESLFEDRKSLYHVILANVLNSRHQVREDISEWVLFFLECVEWSIYHLETRLETLQDEFKVLNAVPVVVTQPLILEEKKEAGENDEEKKEDEENDDEQTNIENEVITVAIGEAETPNNTERKVQFVEKVKDKVEKTMELQFDLFSENSNSIDTHTVDNPLKTNVIVNHSILGDKNVSKIEVYLSPRQKKLKKFIAENQPLRFSDLKHAFPEINQHVLKKDLQYLHRWNEIQKIGDLKTSTYSVLNT